MFKTKRDVDRHVSQLLNKIRNEAERNARGYQFAKLYYDVGDYVSSKRYIQAYLSVREPVSQAHKLLGQVYEKQNEKEKAIEAFKRSLDLEPEQKDLVLKVCELYGDTAVSVNADVAQFWIDKAEKLFPGNYMIFKLKERMIDMNGTVDDGELEHLIGAELSKNPGDVHLHIKLLNHFVQIGDVERAYDHATSTEKTLAFVTSIAWYECLTDIYKTYLDQKGNNDDYTFYTYKLYAVANLTYLRIQADDRDVTSATKALHQFDLDLFEAKGIQRQGSEWQSFLTEMTGQLFYLAALILLRRALKKQVTWGVASPLGAICFLLSDSHPAMDLKSTWYQQVPKDRRKFYERLHYSGYDRLSQGGHVIYSLMSKQNDSAWTKKLRQSTTNSRETLYNLIFTSGEMHRKKSQSYLLQCDVFTSTNLDVPSRSNLSSYDSMAYILHCDNLRHLVWLAVQYHNLKEDVQKDYEQLFGAQLFPKMKFSVADLSGGDPSSLCQLDVQVFFYLCVRWASIQQRDQRRMTHATPDKPEILPVCLSNNMGWCTKAQAEWWTAIYKMERNIAGEKLAKLYGIVMRGLETVRLTMPTALPLSLIVHMAKTLDARAKEIESLDAEGIVTPKLAGVQSRAAYYWKAAEDYLHRMERNQSIKQPKEMLFPLDVATEKEFTKDLKDQVKFAMGMIAMREERFEEALQVFENLYTAAASYHTGIIYRNLADSVDENWNSSGGNMMNNQKMAHLSRAKTALYTTLDRLENHQDEVLKESTRRDLDDVVCKLVSMESGGALMDSILSLPNCSIQEDESDSETEEPVKHPSPRTPVLPTPSRSREIATVSPTRLQVQLKALETTNIALASRISSMEGVHKTQEKLIQELFSQLRELREDSKSLRQQVLQDTMQSMSQMSLQPRPGMPPQFQPTPQQQRNMMNAMNASMGGPAAYDYSMTGGLPPHMSQYGAFQGPVVGSPRPGSAYGQPTLEDEFSHVDGEFYNPEGDEDYYISDQNLVQEWPFGQKAGMEGKSTITYSPQHQTRGINPANAGMFANVLRGQSIQYGGFQPQMPSQPAPPQLPGPGFFSQNSQPMVPPSVQTQAGKFIGQQPQLGVPAKPAGPSPTLSPAMQPPRPNLPSQTSTASPKPASPMMPPNAVASHMAESKPTLNPGSVGVPPMPKKDVSGQTGSAAQLGNVGTSTTPSSGMSGAKPSLLPATSTLMSSMAQGQPGPASSILSQAARHHENTQQTSIASTVPATTPPKPVFGGFTFTSTPKVTDTKKEEDKPKDEVKVSSTAEAPKPFSGFSFTTPTQSPLAQKPTLTGTSPSAQASRSPFSLGQSATTTFGSLAAGGQVASGFGGSSGDTKGFAGAGQTLFGKTPSPRRRNTSAGSDDHVDEYEPNVDFKPVVPLPDLVEVKTGEEDEEKVFGERAKLFRFHTETNQWKERGIGEMKILKHKVTKVYRILMRREQVLKLCANHKITKDLKLAPMSSSDKAWVWTAADFSEGEMKHEKLAVKFKTQDQAERFKNVLEDSQKEMEGMEAARPKEKDLKTKENKEEKKSDGPEKKADSASSGQKSNLASLFKPKDGQWTCTGCYVKSSGDVLKCPCCQSLKPGVSKDDVPKQAAPTAGFGSAGGFSFGGQPISSTGSTGGFKFGSQPAASPSVVSSTTDKKKSDTTSSDQKKDPGLGSAAGFSFGGQPVSSTGSTGGLTFGTPTTTTVSTTPKTGGFTFGTPTTTAASANGSGLAGFKFGADTSAKPETITSSGITLPEPCKPTSGFTFGGKEDASSAGFNVNKDATKYPFGEQPKETTPVESKPATNEKPKIDLSESLLAKYLTSPDPAIEEVSSTTSETNADKGKDVKPSLFGTSAIGGFGKPTATPAPFTFGSTAFGASSDMTAEKKPDSTTVANPFGTPSQSATEGFKFSMTPSSEAEKPQPAAKLGGGFNFSMNMTPTKASPVKPPTVTSPKSPEVSEDGYYVNKEGDDSHIYFEPIVNLPEKVEIKTGEEDEEVLYSHRAKLYRFTKGEWKERGLGDVKILFNNDSQKARILMRREQILKLCCNHYITQDLKFRPMPNTTGNVLSWFAMDFSDGEPQSQQLSIKFKTAEIAESFQKAVELAKTKISEESGEASVNVETIGATADTSVDDIKGDGEVVIVKEVKASPEQIAKARQLLLPDHFYLYELAPQCPGCIGCQSDDEESAETAGNMQVKPSTVAQKVVVKEEDNEDDDDDEYEDLDDEDDDEDEETDEDEDDDEEDDDDGEEQSSNTPQSDLFSGGFMQSTAAGKPSTEPASFVFGESSGALSFSSLASSSKTAFKTDESKPFSWSGAGQKLFGGGSGGGEEGSGDEGDVQQGSDPHFEPIVPLPDLIEVKTGEEEESVEFTQRAKLFRFDADKNEWKEKGIGEMKILKHEETGKYRFLLRREQVHKLACNHLLTPDLNLQPLSTSETSWCWLAQDYSENEPKIEKLAVKFKTIDQAKTFKAKVDEIQQQLREEES